MTNHPMACCMPRVRRFTSMIGLDGRVASVDSENMLFVGMLPRDTDAMTLTELFCPFGEITEVWHHRYGMVGMVGVLASWLQRVGASIT